MSSIEWFFSNKLTIEDAVMAGHDRTKVEETYQLLQADIDNRFEHSQKLEAAPAAEVSEIEIPPTVIGFLLMNEKINKLEDEEKISKVNSTKKMIIQGLLQTEGGSLEEFIARLNVHSEVPGITEMQEDLRQFQATYTELKLSIEKLIAKISFLEQSFVKEGNIELNARAKANDKGIENTSAAGHSRSVGITNQAEYEVFYEQLVNRNQLITQGITQTTEQLVEKQSELKKHAGATKSQGLTKSR